MADKNETVADIAREMRGMPKDWIVDANANFVFVKYADRFEAAHGREVAELRRQREEALTIVNDVEKCASIERQTEAMLKKNGVIAGLRKEVAELRKQTRNCDRDRTDWRWYWGRYVTTQVCPCERKTATPEKHLRYFLDWLFLPKWVTGNDRDGEGSAK